MERQAIYDAVSELEGAVITLEEIQNVLSVFDDQLWEWWECVKNLTPAECETIDDSFNVVYSLLSLSRRQLLGVVDVASTAVDQAYEVLKAAKTA
ncbi:MAG: hypothetical protein E7451_00915 [Ruminococcaceae bacterium]|nr:hypothetical protein [Oscillospiraceae bacterium]